MREGDGEQRIGRRGREKRNIQWGEEDKDL